MQKYALAGGAQEGVADPGMPTGSDDDQVGVQGPRRLDDPRRRLPRFDDGPHR